MANITKRKHQKDMTVIIGSFVIVLICIGTVGWLQYQSLTRGVSIPEYSIAFFASIATLIIGYTFGKFK